MTATRITLHDTGTETLTAEWAWEHPGNGDQAPGADGTLTLQLDAAHGSAVISMDRDEAIELLDLLVSVLGDDDEDDEDEGGEA
jgi:hypothetical protein